MTSQLGQLLRSLGREDHETVSVLTQVPGHGGVLNVHWTTVEGADSLVDSLVGCNVWFGVQPLDRPDTGRGRATDCTGIVALYADIDWKREGKPDGISPVEALQFVDALSDILGAEPVNIVASGNGIQPYWRIERQDVEFGRQLLSWWRQQVLKVAANMKVSIDSQVYDLPRILRAPGPDNLKDPENPRPTRLVHRGGGTLTREQLFMIMQLNPGETSPNSDYSQYDRRGGDLSPRDGVRYFTPDQAYRYIEEHIMPDLRQTPEGAGFNNALNRAAFSLAAFHPAFMTEDQAAAMLADECARRWGSANLQDWATIDSGFRGCEWEACEAPEEMASNPFWEHYEGPEDLPLAPGRRIVERHYDPHAVLEDSDQDTVTVEIQGRAFRRAAVQQKVVPTEACYLSDGFWAARPILGAIRELAWATRTCPEAVLIGTFALLAGNIMPNMKVHGGIGSPAAMNTMGLLIGIPGGGKSVSWKVVCRYIEIVGGAKAPHFTPSSGQGVPAMYGTWRKAKGTTLGYFERTRFNAIGFLDETDNIASLRETKGNTLSSTLRSAAMGGELGSQTVDVERRTQINEGTYSFSLIACGQPLRMGWLLNADEMGGGLPQRFLWAPAVSLYHPTELGSPEDVMIGLPLEAQGNPNGNAFSTAGAVVPKQECVIMAPESVCSQIIARYERRQMFGGDPMLAHVDLTRLKIAGYLSIMAGRVYMTVEDWDLAGEVVRMSVSTSQWTWAQLAEHEKTEARTRSAAKGRADAGAAIANDEELIKHAASLILPKVNRSPDGIGSAGLVSGKLRPYRDAAIEHLVGNGLIRAEDVTNGRKLFPNA